MASQDSREVKARYESPTDTKDFTLLLSSKCYPELNVEQKTAYLSELRTSTKKMQESINTFLTDKMAQDKARESASVAGDQTFKPKTKDEVEEENYGEEAAEDDG